MSGGGGETVVGDAELACLAILCLSIPTVERKIEPLVIKMLLEPVYQRDFLGPLLWLPALSIGPSSSPGHRERHDGFGLRLVNAVGITKCNNTINYGHLRSFFEQQIRQRDPTVDRCATKSKGPERRATVTLGRRNAPR